MKKSIIYFAGAAISFLLSITWSFLIFWNLRKAMYIPLLSFPFTGFVLILPGIFLVKKGINLYNVENGRPATDVPTYSKNWRMVNYSAITLIILMAIVLTVKWVIN